ncbi:MAG: hypothetical protein AAF191_07540, partial [Verrucomicrobiota bacterium]
PAEMNLLGDIILGVTQPGKGEVTFRGKSWEARSLSEDEALRRSVGRVYARDEGARWIENLELDENVQLAQSFDPLESREHIERRARELSGELGLGELPKTRPAATEELIQQKAQWVRALLPDPLRLLILEEPLEGVPKEEQRPFLDVVRQRRKEGVAILWMEERNGRTWEEELEPDRILGEDLIPKTGTST